MNVPNGFIQCCVNDLCNEAKKELELETAIVPYDFTQRKLAVCVGIWNDYRYYYDRYGFMLMRTKKTEYDGYSLEATVSVYNDDKKWIWIPRTYLRKYLSSVSIVRELPGIRFDR